MRSPLIARCFNLVLLECPYEVTVVVKPAITKFTFQSLFYWNALMRPVSKKLCHLIVFQFQSLFYWNALMRFSGIVAQDRKDDVSILVLLECPYEVVQPNGCAARVTAYHIQMFQSLFYWNALMRVIPLSKSVPYPIVFQSLFYCPYEVYWRKRLN